MADEFQEPDSPKDALVLIVRDATANVANQCYWKPGMPSPFQRVVGLRGETVQIVAHGKALEWVYANFDGIRKCRGKLGARWVGEDAVFIVNNLRAGD